MSLLVKAVLVALVTWLTFFDKYCTQFFTYRPIVIGPIIGLIMGDLKMGLMVGCTIELMFLGQVFVDGTFAGGDVQHHHCNCICMYLRQYGGCAGNRTAACNSGADVNVFPEYGALRVDPAQAGGRC